MEDLVKQEIFEIEVLERLKNAKLLEPLVFIGGTMLRLCHELNRYSVDMDFWFVNNFDTEAYFHKMKNILEKNYTITDSMNMFFTIIFEIKSPNYPRRLKIEIRKKIQHNNYEERIAFSRYTSGQILVKVLTLEEMMKNKILAFLQRKEIRDCYDIEFLLRRGIPLNAPKNDLRKMVKIIKTFKPNDYKVTLGSVLEPEIRHYYTQNNFAFLMSKITTVESGHIARHRERPA